MVDKRIDSFIQAATALGKTAQTLLGTVGEQDMALAGEIRLRVGSPAALSLPTGLKIVGRVPVTKLQMEEMLLCLCGHSVYSHQQELAEGYIRLPGGHRAGVCGTAVVKNGEITALRDVSSICLRIAREHRGCAEQLFEAMFSGGVCSAVIAGAPGSGKTTVLRDLARLLAGGAAGRRLRVSLIDERGELAMDDLTQSACSAASACDVLSGYPKGQGILQATRVLSPDVIICDELGDRQDIDAVAAGINAGVSIICSVHAGSAAELALRPLTTELLGTGAFRRFAVLRGRDAPGRVSEILTAEEMYELACGSAYRAVRMADGPGLSGQAAQTSGCA